MADTTSLWIIQKRAEARKRLELIERAASMGIRITGVGGYGNTDKVAVDVGTFVNILDRLSHLDSEK